MGRHREAHRDDARGGRGDGGPTRGRGRRGTGLDAAREDEAKAAKVLEGARARRGARQGHALAHPRCSGGLARRRSEEHTSELQSRENLVCRLLLEKKKKITKKKNGREITEHT